MSYGPVSVFSVTMTTGTTLTSSVDLQKAWNRISVAVPTMPSGTDIYFQSAGQASAAASPYRRLYHPTNSNSSAVGANFLGSSVTNCIVPVNNGHVRYLKVEFTTAMTAAAVAFEIICSD